MNTYEIFKNHELKIAEKIQQRRLQLLVHSCIYYHLDQNIISDSQWDKWARELVQLQKDYPGISNKVIWYEAFKDWDASTGAFLPIKDEWVIQKAKSLLYQIPSTVSVRSSVEKKPPIINKKSAKKRKLF